MASKRKTTKTKTPQKVKLPKVNFNFKNLKEKFPKIKINKKYIGGALLAIILGITFFRFKNLVVAAMVNGEPISRFKIISELEKRSGSQALDSIITQTLISQEAKKQNINVTQTEIDNQINSLENSLKSQGQDLNSALATQGMTKEDLITQISLQKMVEKLVGKDIEIKDQQIDDYIKANKDTFPKDEKPEDIRSKVKNQLFQQALSQKFQTWITDLKSKAHITYFIKY
ncbi:MAG: SurA N-terminal domain-containing protein [Candidatus Woesebacteria bacterium]|nr:MAG: SurA N-terminal domain-containing protein [Candidatus Woesebacteria bacterium]